MLRKLRILTTVVLFTLTVGTTLAQASKTAKQSAKEVINYVFPKQTQSIMLRIADCETGGTFNPYSHNRSGASGYFQVLSGHDGTTYTYNGISITVDKDKLFDPHYNTLVAYLMSNGGTNLHPWDQSRSCWD